MHSKGRGVWTGKKSGLRAACLACGSVSASVLASVSFLTLYIVGGGGEYEVCM